VNADKNFRSRGKVTQQILRDPFRQGFHEGKLFVSPDGKDSGTDVCIVDGILEMIGPSGRDEVAGNLDIHGEALACTTFLLRDAAVTVKLQTRHKEFIHVIRWAMRWGSLRGIGTSAAGLGIGVLDRETGFIGPFNKIDLRSGQEGETLGIQKNPDPVLFDHLIIFLRRFFHIHAVFVAAAAST
jgi:hypothetical protein